MAPSPTSPTTIYITRHGFGEHNRNTEVFMGRSPEAPLTPQGREEARRLGARLAGGEAIHRIVASSLPRTMETAEIIAGLTRVDRLSPEKAFWELSKGDWEGVMPRELPPEIKREVEADPFAYRYGGAESYRDVVARAAPAFDRWVGAHPGETLLFVLHGDVIRALLYHIIRFPGEKIGDFAIDPCSLTELVFSQGRYLVVRLNDTSHLA